MLKKVTYNNNNSTNVRDKRIKQKNLHLFLKTMWGIWPSLSEKLVHRLFFSPVKYHLNNSEKLLLNHGKPFQIIVHNKKIQCWRWGKGPTLILAHGWNGRGVQG